MKLLKEKSFIEAFNECSEEIAEVLEKHFEVIKFNPIEDMDNVTVNDSTPGHGYIYIGTGFFYNIVVGHYI